MIILSGVESSNSAFPIDSTGIIEEAGSGTVVPGVVFSSFLPVSDILPFWDPFSQPSFWLAGLVVFGPFVISVVFSGSRFTAACSFTRLFRDRIWPGSQFVCRSNNVASFPLLLP